LRGLLALIFVAAGAVAISGSALALCLKDCVEVRPSLSAFLDTLHPTLSVFDLQPSLLLGSPFGL
jgi:hypothetical protein